MWPIWSSNHVSPRDSPDQIRDNIAGGPWEQHSDLFGPSNFDFAFSLYGMPPGPPPSNTVAECGEWNSALLPLPEGATATSVYASKVSAPSDEWLVGGYDTGEFSSMRNALARLSPRRRRRLGNRADAEPRRCCSDGGNPNTARKSGSTRSTASRRTTSGPAAGARSDRRTASSAGSSSSRTGTAAQWIEVPAPVTNAGSGAEIAGIKAIAPNDVWFVGSWIERRHAGQRSRCTGMARRSTWSMCRSRFAGRHAGLVARRVRRRRERRSLGRRRRQRRRHVARARISCTGTARTGNSTKTCRCRANRYEFNALLTLGANDIYAGGSWLIRRAATAR